MVIELYGGKKNSPAYASKNYLLLVNSYLSGVRQKTSLYLQIHAEEIARGSALKFPQLVVWWVVNQRQKDGALSREGLEALYLFFLQI